MDIHAYSQLWMTPWGYARKYPADYNELVSYPSPAPSKSKTPAAILFPRGRAPFGQSAPKITTSGRVQHRKSLIHGLNVNSDKSDWLKTRNEYSDHGQKIRSG